jgi:hypothetical protein
LNFKLDYKVLSGR